MRLAGKTIVVTGGSSGLGRAMSLAFSREGADVVIGDIRDTPREGGTRTDRLIAERGGSAVYVEADASRSDDIDRLVSAAVERGGRLDVLVNNAIVAGPHSRGLLETDDADWDAIMAVGCRGVFLCCKRAIAQMLGQEPRNEARGRVINLSSQHGMVGTPGHVAYCGADNLKLIADYYKPDLVLMPIGGHFVMDPTDAAYATREWLKPKFVVPMHYGTFPVLKGTPQEYVAALGQTATKVFVINPGDKLEF